MDVHPPHKPIESWREFFVHLITITIGLLIALGLENTVEWMHHRHLVHEAKENIHQELVENQKLIQEDLTAVRQDEERLKHNLQVLEEFRTTHKFPKTTLMYRMDWSSLNDSAWKTARDTGAFGYMEYKVVQDFADAYKGQEIVNNMAVELFNDQVKAISPAFASGGELLPDKLTTEQVNMVCYRTADLMLSLRQLEQILNQLNDQYTKLLKGA